MIEEIALTFKAMGTEIEAVVCAPEARKADAERALSRVQALFEEADSTLSRFDPHSEISRLNSADGKPFKASPMLFEVVRAALDASRATDGVFDPTILPALLAAGYDRDFALLQDGPRAEGASSTRRQCAWRDVRLDAPSTISLPARCALDLGGIAKGWTVDRAAQYLREFPGYAVDAGGDIVVGGARPDGAAWTVGVADPFQPERDLTVIRLSRGAVCTSSTVKRSWSAAGERRHHLIDPLTGRPSCSSVVAATVVAETAALAETITKSAIILGPEAGIRFIEEQPDAEGLLMLADGRMMVSSGIPTFQHVT